VVDITHFFIEGSITIKKNGPIQHKLLIIPSTPPLEKGGEGGFLLIS
jgi:hypothetical protein